MSQHFSTISEDAVIIGRLKSCSLHRHGIKRSVQDCYEVRFVDEPNTIQYVITEKFVVILNPGYDVANGEWTTNGAVLEFDPHCSRYGVGWLKYEDLNECFSAIEKLAADRDRGEIYLVL